MESILIHPESAEQLKAVKAFLKALKVPFEPQAVNLPAHVLKGIEKSTGQYLNGQTISLEEFKNKHFSKK
jgi:methionine synthase I (cobalamin-dependent)